MSPEEKETVVSILNRAGETTLMCGDGTNDVGALRHAHVGVAILTEEAERAVKEMKEKERDGRGKGRGAGGRGGGRGKGGGNWKERLEQAAEVFILFIYLFIFIFSSFKNPLTFFFLG